MSRAILQNFLPDALTVSIGYGTHGLRRWAWMRLGSPPFVIVVSRPARAYASSNARIYRRDSAVGLGWLCGCPRQRTLAHSSCGWPDRGDLWGHSGASCLNTRARDRTGRGDVSCLADAWRRPARRNRPSIGVFADPALRAFGPDRTSRPYRSCRSRQRARL